MSKFCSIAFLFLSGCTTPARFSYPIPETKAACMKLFEDVMTIQDIRSDASDAMNGWVERFNSGDLSVRSYRKKYYKWKTDENILRNRVTLIYDVGYAAGCFNPYKEW